MDEQVILNFLKDNNIAYHLYEHQPVFTVDDKPVVTAVDGVPSSAAVPKPHFKTLFLKDKNSVFFLVAVIEDKRVDLRALSDALGSGRFSFGKPEELLEMLKLTPGAVTPFGLLFDKDHKILFVFDEDALSCATVSFHPMRNDMTLVLTPQDFLKSMEKMGYIPQIMNIPVKKA